MARFVTLVAVLTVTLQVSESFKALGRSKHAVATPPRLFTTKTSRALADAGASTTVHQDHGDHARTVAAAAATRAASRAVPALAGPQATSETLSIDAARCATDAPLEGLTAAICRTAADASPTNNYCFTSDVLTETLDDGLLTIVANNCASRRPRVFR